MSYQNREFYLGLVSSLKAEPLIAITTSMNIREEFLKEGVIEGGKTSLIE
jgi:hypothetical protein